MRKIGMAERIIIAGAGGQGVMLLGRILAEAAMREGKFVTWLPSYGAEVRGGTAHCMVIISGQQISSPYIEEADTLIIMNAPSWARFKNRIKKNGLCIINSSLVDSGADSPKALKYPFTDMACKIGNIKVANMAALGCLLGRKDLVEAKTIFRVIEDITPSSKKGLIQINQKALEEGMKLR